MKQMPAIKRIVETTEVEPIPASVGRETGAGGQPDMIELCRQIHSWYAQNYIEQRDRRRLVWKIDTWLAQRGSPMVGCGEYYVQGQERTGIPATLSVGIAEAESSSGMACFAPHNAFGMLAYPGGWGSWEEAIAANFDWLVRYYGCPQGMSACPGYCEGDGTMGTVDAVMRMINSLDASGVQ